ncbi:ubiquinone/menaquinone biosynthesis methyltransferase [Thermodesulfobacteriota bacterium]
MPPSHCENDKATYVRNMFQSIAPSYDCMNRLITFGRDQTWRRYVVKTAALSVGGIMLDLGTGTGMIAMEALRCDPSVRVIAVDFSLRMMKEGCKKNQSERLSWHQADAMKLPFKDASVDAVTSGYLMRNVTDVLKALKEQVRVVKPNGHVVCLDTTPPPRNLVRPFILFHMKFLIPALGKLIAGNREAYSYLPDSTDAFLEPIELTAIMKKAGLENVSYRRFMFGTQMVCFGNRPKKRIEFGNQ